MQFVNIVKPTHICNLDCTYCYNDDVRDPVMRAGTLHRTIEQTFAYVRATPSMRGAEFIWHGGEPTVAGLPFFEQVVALQRELADGIGWQNSLQTNGVLLDDRWIDFLVREQFSLSISLDGPAHINDRYRVTHRGGGSFERVFKAVERAREAGLPFGVCMVLSEATAPHVDEIYDFFSSHGLPFNVIPMTRSGAARDRFDDIGLDADGYARAWTRMYDRWLDSGDEGGYVYVQDFALKTRAIASGKAADCIGLSNCSHFNVSTDPVGDVYPCASLSGNSAMCYGNLTTHSLAELLDTPLARALKHRAVDPQCAQCKWQHVCHGGCAARAYKFHGDPHQRDRYCPGLFQIYEHIERRLRERGLPTGLRHPLHMSDGIDHATYGALAGPMPAPGSKPHRVIPVRTLAANNGR